MFPRGRGLSSTLEAVRLSVAATRGRGFTLLYGSRKSPYVELTDSGYKYDFRPFLDCLSLPRPMPSVLPWPEIVNMLSERVGVPIEARQVTYLAPSRVAAGGSSRGSARQVHDRLEGEGLEVVAPGSWGFDRLPRGRGPLPPWLGYLASDRIRMHNATVDRGSRGTRTMAAVVRRLWGAVVAARNNGRRAGEDVSVWAWRGRHGWPQDSRGPIFPRNVLQDMGLVPEIWIRRRISRGGATVSLSLFGAHKRARGWVVHDLTAPLALHCTDAETCTLWRRAVYLVERGDGLEWIILRPSHDGRDGIASGVGCGVPLDEYEGSPARHLLARLREIWPSVRVRWILDEKPFPRTGKRSEGDLH